MYRTTLSAALVLGLSAVIWCPLGAKAQTSSVPAPPVATSHLVTVKNTYLQGYLTMLDGDKLRQAKDFVGAYFKYRDARDLFDAVYLSEPSWNPEILKYRRQKIRKGMEDVRQDEIQCRQAESQPTPHGLSGSGMKNADTPGDVSGTSPVSDLSGNGRTPSALLEEGNNDLFPALDLLGTGLADASPSLPAKGGAAVVPLTSLPPDTANASPPVLTSTAFADGQFTASFTTVPGFSYRMESSTDLTAWAPEGSAVTGDGTVKSLSTGVTGTGRRFFRISRLP